MKSFTQKKEELAKLKDKFSKAKIAVITSFAKEKEKGLNVSEMRVLKKSLLENNSEYSVAKKTLLDKAITTDEKVNVFDFNGSLGVVFGYGDEQTTAKTIYNFSRKNPAMKLFSAIFGKQSKEAGKTMDEKMLVEYAKLPSREILIGRILGLMKYPMSALANVLGQVAKTK